ncbi:MAG: putative quinol monooxygenase [Bacteroidota bacterium]
MILRIVKMKVAPEKVAIFRGYFQESYSKIRNFQGCHELALYTDVNDPGVVITYSKWDHEDALNLYRDSAVFKSTWEKVKPLFIAKPEAFSMAPLL